ncbi:hypothetical protein, conserved, partial [Eimeria maxima]
IASPPKEDGEVSAPRGSVDAGAPQPASALNPFGSFASPPKEDGDVWIPRDPVDTGAPQPASALNPFGYFASPPKEDGDVSVPRGSVDTGAAQPASALNPFGSFASPPKEDGDMWVSSGSVGTGAPQPVPTVDLAGFVSPAPQAEGGVGEDVWVSSGPVDTGSPEPLPSSGGVEPPEPTPAMSPTPSVDFLQEAAAGSEPWVPPQQQPENPPEFPLHGDKESAQSSTAIEGSTEEHKKDSKDHRGGPSLSTNDISGPVELEYIAAAIKSGQLQPQPKKGDPREK